MRDELEKVGTSQKMTFQIFSMTLISVIKTGRLPGQAVFLAVKAVAFMLRLAPRAEGLEG